MQPVKQIVDKAWADIQARLPALCVKHGAPSPTFAYGVSDWFSRLKYPVLFLTLDYIRQESSATMGEELQVSMDLVLVHTATKPEILQQHTIGYTDAMLELIRDDHTFGGACQIGEFVGSDLYAAAQDGRDLAIAMISVLLREEVQI